MSRSFLGRSGGIPGALDPTHLRGPKWPHDHTPPCARCAATGNDKNDKIFMTCLSHGAWRSNERPAVLSKGRRRKRNSDWPHSNQISRAQNLWHLPKTSASADRGETHSVQQGSASWKTSTKRCSSKGQNLAGELHEAKGRRLTTSNDIRRRPVPGTQSKTTLRDAWSCVKYRAFHVVGRMTSGNRSASAACKTPVSAAKLLFCNPSLILKGD